MFNMKPVLLLPLLICVSVSDAGQGTGLVQLEAAMHQLKQEQQSVYQQFLMTQELRSNALQDIAPTMTEGYSVIGGVSTGTLDYDENVRLQRERVERLERYDRELERAYARFLELGERKKALLDQIIELSQPAQP